MPFKNSVYSDDKEVKLDNLPLRRSKRLNSNLSTMIKELDARCSSETSEEFSQSENTKSTVINEVTPDSATETAKFQEETLTSTCIEDSVAKQNNEVTNESDTNRITRSHTNSKAKIIIKECFVILGEINKIHDATVKEPKIKSEEINDAAYDKATNVNESNVVEGNENREKYEGTFNNENIQLQENEELNISTNKDDSENGKSETCLENVIGKVQTSTTHENKSSAKCDVENSLEFKETQVPTDSTNQILNTSDAIESSFSSNSTDHDHVNVGGRGEDLDNGDSLLNSSLEKMEIHPPSFRETAIDLKIDDLLSRSFSTSENEDEGNPFVDSMAEEGEEDTPSEGSNDIIEVGEEINSTESEFSTDESYENNSFIDDDENEHQLLSGEEYDLSFDKPKKSRIIQLSSGSDDDIVRISKPKKDQKKKRKKSRIIKFSDSSDDEDISCILDTRDDIKENELCNAHLKETSTECDNDINAVAPDQVVVNYQDNKTEENTERTDISNNENKHSSNESNKMEISHASVNEYEKEIKVVDVNCTDQSDSINQREDEGTSAKIEHNECDEVNNLSTSLAIVNVRIVKKTQNRSFLAAENMKVENTSNKRLSERINEVIDSLCSTIKNVNEIAISLSVGNSDFKNKVDVTKLSPDGPKRKRLPKKRKACRKKLLREDTTEHKSKKIKLDEEGTREHLSPNCTQAAAVSVKNKKSKNNQTGKMPVSPLKVDKQLQNENDCITTVAVLKKEHQGPSKDTRTPVFQPIHVKKKTRTKKTKKGIRNLRTTMNILDEALFDIENKKASFLNEGVQFDEQWNVKKVSTKRQSISEEQVNKMEHEAIKQNKSENIDTHKKIIAKDFKNLMLYDSSRIKRIDTKQMMKKRSLSANAQSFCFY